MGLWETHYTDAWRLFDDEHVAEQSNPNERGHCLNSAYIVAFQRQRLIF